ncbi:hypothetical protein [Cypionkella sp. TWP1-2-1b2]|uniref:hypothetical protein n=1 Tax=Cypionkella sp. TWP1-2-1b2 TaxID=2804675 RepID=UPI003CF16EF6
MNDDEETGPSTAEQFAFTRAHDLFTELTETGGLQSAHVGSGFLTAAVHALSKGMTDEKIAELLYRYADDRAVRGR